MSQITKPNTLSAGNPILATEHNENFNVLYNDFNGNITNYNFATTAGITDDKLATIVSAGKVNFTALGTASISSGSLLYASSSTSFAQFATGTSGQYLSWGTLLDNMEFANSSTAQTTYVTNVATSYSNTGGTITTDGAYTVHKFTTDGTFHTGKAGSVEFLLVGGGGAGGGAFHGAGGGAGGVISNATYSVTSKDYAVTVGVGGTGVQYFRGNSGEDTTFDNNVALGGGGGGAEYAGDSANGGNGGCGGGASNPGTKGTGSQGYDGGGGSYACGGGGMGQAGATGPGGKGGDGIQSDILVDSSNVYYAGGGGGSNYWGVPGAGGQGGGGAGDNSAPVAGTDGYGGGGGGSERGGTQTGADGGDGVAIFRCLTTDFLVLQSFSESVIRTQGSYSLKGVATTGALNKTLTRTVSPTINLTGGNTLKFDIRSSRTGSNIKLGIHDSGGTTTETTPNITNANVWQTITWDISAVANADKDDIDEIIITVVNADAENTFYIDNFYCMEPAFGWQGP